MSRVFRLDQAQPVLLVLDEVEVPGEDRGSFCMCAGILVASFSMAWILCACPLLIGGKH